VRPDGDHGEGCHDRGQEDEDPGDDRTPDPPALLTLHRQSHGRLRGPVVELRLDNVTLKAMDATVMDFGDDEFDSAVATYTISAVPDPVGVLREMRRVVKPGGNIVLLNHFRSQGPLAGRFEDLVAPVCTRLGWKSNLHLEPLLKQVALTADVSAKVNLFNGWRLIRCVNSK